MLLLLLGTAAGLNSSQAQEPGCPTTSNKCACEAWREDCDAYGLKCQNYGLVDVNSQFCTTNFRYQYCPRGPTTWYFDERKTCHCEPPFKGIECQLDSPGRCANLTSSTGKPLIFDGTYLNPASIHKKAQCYIDYDATTATLFDLINHRVYFTLDQDTVVFELWTRTRPLGGEACGGIVNALTCNLTSCKAVSKTAPEGPVASYTCQQFSCRSCNEKLCSGYAATARLLSDTVSQPITLEFSDISAANGKAKGRMKIRQEIIVIDLSLTCETGQCVEEIAPPPEQLTNVNVIVTLAVIVGMIVLCLLLMAVVVYVYRGNKAIGVTNGSSDANDEAATKLLSANPGDDQVHSDASYALMNDAIMQAQTPAQFLPISYEAKGLKNDPGDGRMHLMWRNIRVTMNPTRSTTREVLKGICGAVTATEMVAILGPSGAGKTTLLDVVAQRRSGSACTGTIQIVGSGRPRVTGSLMSYVEQSEMLLDTQTVRETLMFSAALRCSANDSVSVLNKQCEKVMSQLKIAHIADSRIGNADTGGISGGERKRVSIGVELVVGPAMLLLDEPTSGLDSTNVGVLMTVLREVARNGCGVLFTIHQVPAHEFLQFDQILLLGQNGRVLFFGSPSHSIKHLANNGLVIPSHTNPAEFLLDAASVDKKKLDEVSDAYAQSQSFQDLSRVLDELDTQSNNAAGTDGKPTRGCCWQTRMLCLRQTRHFSRDLTLVTTHMIVTVCMGALLGGIFWNVDNAIPGIQNRVGLLFFLTIYFSLTAMSALGVFVNHRKLYWRESTAGYYGVFPYFFSTIGVDLIPLRVLPPLILGVICYFMIGLQEDEDRLMWFLFVLVLVNVVATAACFVVSALSESVAQGTFIAVIFFIFCMMFGGLFLSNESDGPLTALRYGSFYFYAYEALMVNEFVGLELIFNPKDVDPFAITGVVILNNYGMSTARFYCDVYGLCGFFVVFLYLSLIFLCFTNSPVKLLQNWKNTLVSMLSMWFLILLPLVVIVPLVLLVDWCGLNDPITPAGAKS